MTTFGGHLTNVMYALGDPTEQHWSRTSEVWKWLIEAIREFPILRGKTTDLSDAVENHKFDLPSDFVEIVNVQWPISSDYIYLVRRSHQDKYFFDGDYYDIDRNFPDSAGWMLWTGPTVTVASPVRVNYLALHDYNASESMVITIPDQYLNILTEYCIMRAWQERLSNEIRDPTAHSDIIQNMELNLKEHRRNYQLLVEQALKELNTSRIVANRLVDKYDRIY